MGKGLIRRKSFITKKAALSFAKKYKKKGYGSKVKRKSDKFGSYHYVEYYRKK
jgi:hypothetical protein